MNAGNRCYACYRPLAACFCAAIPTIENRTEVLILQHRRERAHPFNTARIVSKALRNSQLLADHTANLSARLELKPGAAVLYPAPPATLITELPPEQRPTQLIVLDGTWHHAKTLMRDIPALQALPRYRLAPEAPSRYRIRREPSATSLSTIEAAVAALRVLEPETAGFESLLAAFETMVERQLAHPRSASRPGGNRPRKRSLKNVPFALLGNLENIVVAYGESPGGARGENFLPGPPLSWVAHRLGDGTTFSCTITPSFPLDDALLGHLALTHNDFASAISLSEARARWAEFQRPQDIVAVFYPGTARLFKFLGGPRATSLVLKSVNLATLQLPRALDQFEPAPELSASALPRGRAGQRLACTLTVVRHLAALARKHQLTLSGAC